jgi:hypothetical protein
MPIITPPHWGGPIPPRWHRTRHAASAPVPAPGLLTGGAARRQCVRGRERARGAPCRARGERGGHLRQPGVRRQGHARARRRRPRGRARARGQPRPGQPRPAASPAAPAPADQPRRRRRLRGPPGPRPRAHPGAGARAGRGRRCHGRLDAPAASGRIRSRCRFAPPLIHVIPRLASTSGASVSKAAVRPNPLPARGG